MNKTLKNSTKISKMLHCDVINIIASMLDQSDILNLRLADKSFNDAFDHWLLYNDIKIVNADDDGLEHINGMMNIRNLNLIWCVKITDDGLEHISNMNIRNLNLTGCVKITDDGLEYISKMTNIRNHNLSHCDNITNN